MSVHILMPQLGETVAEGKITTWFKSIGDRIQPGDNLFEIDTDKVSMEVPAISTGVLSEIRVKEGEVAPVGAIVGVIAENSADTSRSSASNSSQAVAHKPAFKLEPYMEVRTPERNFGPSKRADGARVTPLARRLAGESGVELARLRGSGPNGRIVAKDIQYAIASSPSAPAVATAVAQSPPGPSSQSIKDLYRDVSYEEVPLDAMRKIIAQRLTRAASTIPQFYISTDVEIDRMLALREEANASGERKGGAVFKLSLNDFVIKAFALALQRIPAANVVWAEDRILRFRHSDIGVAVATDGGLLTPVIREAEAKPISVISAMMKDLAARARARKLLPQEYQGGAAAISNLGMYGVRSFSAIINPPHASILAVGAASRRPIEAEGGAIRFTTQMTVTLTCDHRAIDGVVAAELLAAFKTLVESPITILI
jgi:pyruvate dehydrogenase E2 component (dihydrolipoamide acetyltransferase)